jgi:hypothetical protein
MRIPRPLVTVLRAAITILLLLGSATITLASLVYFGEDLAPFVMDKLPLPLEDVWMLALKTHVVAAMVSLPACLFLFSATVQRRLPRVHRWVGRATGVILLFALVPSGFYLSLFAKGGLPSTIGFMLSGAIVAVGMVQGVRTARARRYVEHRRWVLHVIAQLSVAVTSRAMLFGFDAAGVDEELAYIVALWLPVVGSFIVAELLSARKNPSLATRRNNEASVAARRSRLRPTDVRAAGSGG